MMIGIKIVFEPNQTWDCRIRLEYIEYGRDSSSSRILKSCSNSAVKNLAKFKPNSTTLTSRASNRLSSIEVVEFILLQNIKLILKSNTILTLIYISHSKWNGCSITYIMFTILIFKHYNYICMYVVCSMYVCIYERAS
jgi:hypothetical protein